MVIHVFVDEVPAGRSFGGFNYKLLYDPGRSQVASATHEDSSINLLASAAGSQTIDLSESTPDSDGSFSVGVADFGVAEAGPAKGVLGRYSLTIPSTAQTGGAALSLAGVVVSDAAGSEITVDQVNGAWLAIGVACSGLGPPPAGSSGSGSGSSGGGSSGSSGGGSYSGAATDTPRVIATINLVEGANEGSTPRQIAVNPLTDRIYVANADSDNMMVIDTTTNMVVSTVPLPPPETELPWGVAVNPNTKRIYVSHQVTGNVSVIDSEKAESDPQNAVITTVGVGLTPKGVAVNTTTNRIYVANDLTHNVSVIDGATNTLVATIDLGAGHFGWGIAVNPSTDRIYAGHYLATGVSVIDGTPGSGTENTVIATIDVRGRCEDLPLPEQVRCSPKDVAVNAVTNRIYVANNDSDDLSVFDGATNSVIDTVPVGDVPHGVGVNRNSDRIYGSNHGDDEVPGTTASVIDGAANSVITSVTVGTRPEGVGVNESTALIYVANSGSDSVSVICPDDPTNDPTNTDADLNAAGAGHGPGDPPPPLPADEIRDTCDNDDDNDSLAFKSLPPVNSDCPSSVDVALFRDCIENYVGTNALDNCAGAPPGSGGDAWPPDFDANQWVNIVDVLALKPVFNTTVPPTSPRFDLNADHVINILDVQTLNPVFNHRCT